MDMSLNKFQEMVKDWESWHAAVHGVAKSWIWLSDWTITTVQHMAHNTDYFHELTDRICGPSSSKTLGFWDFPGSPEILNSWGSSSVSGWGSRSHMLWLKDSTCHNKDLAQPPNKYTNKCWRYYHIVSPSRGLNWFYLDLIYYALCPSDLGKESQENTEVCVFSEKVKHKSEFELNFEHT